MSVKYVHRSLSPELPFRDWPLCRGREARVLGADRRLEQRRTPDRNGAEIWSVGVMHAERYARISERIKIRFSETSRRNAVTRVYFLTDAECRAYEAQDSADGSRAIDAQWCLMVFHDREEAYWCVPESRRWHVFIDLPNTFIESVDVVD